MQNIPQDLDRKRFATFYIVRHGQTQWNVDGIIQGRHDSPLTEEGLRQIGEVAQEFKHVRFAAAFSSDLLRAKRTAEIIALEHNLAVVTTKKIRERDFGIYDGKPNNTAPALESVLKSLTDEEIRVHKPWEGYESDEEVIGRFITFLRETAVAFPGRNVLVATHSGSMRVLLIHLGFTTHKLLPHGTIGNTAYITLLSDGVDFYIEETKGIHPLT